MQARKAHLTKEQRSYILGLIDARARYKEIAGLFEARYHRRISLGTISNQKRAPSTSQMGRKKITSAFDDQQMFFFVRANQWKSWRELARLLISRGITISPRTLRRRMSKEFGLKSHVAKSKPKITPTLAAQRLQFAQRYI